MSQLNYLTEYMAAAVSATAVMVLGLYADVCTIIYIVTFTVVWSLLFVLFVFLYTVVPASLKEREDEDEH